jgi:SagB-type dehydrogenase family enzyme
MLKGRMTKYDISYLISVQLLIGAVITAISGLVSDLWDLNEFVYHKYTAYPTAALALAHVCLHWRQLVGYIRWRLGRKARGQEGRGDRKEEFLCHSRTSASLLPLSRRGFVGLILGGLGGFALGRGLRPQPTLPYGGDIGAIYHEWSKPKVLSILGTVTNWGSQPPPYKEFLWAAQISLPPPDDFRGLYTEDAITRRRSVRDYSGQLMTLVELSRLLYYMGGINAERWGYKLRAAPSAGALYPIEVYLVIHRVEGLKPGLYHYAVQNHALELLRTGDLRGETVRHGLMQEFLGQANLVLVLTAIFQRLRWKYQERSYRYALLEAGHLGQNVYLAATSMGMGACAVGAFLDDDLNAMLGIDGQHEAAIYMLAVGKV